MEMRHVLPSPRPVPKKVRVIYLKLIIVNSLDASRTSFELIPLPLHPIPIGRLALGDSSILRWLCMVGMPVLCILGILLPEIGIVRVFFLLYHRLLN
jgi:hypothetical protein